MKKIILIFCTILSLNAEIDKSKFVKNPQIIIFDIGETLITINKLKAFKHLGLFNIVGYFFKSLIFDFNLKYVIPENFKNHIRDDIYLNTLSKIPSPFQTPDYEINGINNKPMPPLMRDVTLGKISCKNCIKIAEDWLNKNNDCFENITQKTIFKKTLYLNFKPKKLIKHYKYTPQIKLLKKLYNDCDDQGKRKNICIILSNQPKEMLKLIKDNFPEIFDFTDEQIFSCEEGLSKPHPKLFKKCLDFCPELSKKNIFFIDDEISNIKECRKINFYNYNIIGLFPDKAEEMLYKFNIL